MKAHQKVFKMLSVLLQYPQREWIGEISEIALEVEQLNDIAIQKNLKAFFDYIKNTPFDQLCENYVNTFDYHGVTTLHLTYNVFKDSRKRGEALIELQRLFQTVDLEKTSTELPDFLPLILEFLSIAEKEQIQQLLKLHQKSLHNLQVELVKAKSEYSFLIKVINEVTKQQIQNENVS